MTDSMLPYNCTSMVTCLFAFRLVFDVSASSCRIGLEEELVDCSGGEDINLEAGTQRKLQALMQVSLTPQSFT